MTKMLPFERAISVSYLVPIVIKALFLSVFSQLNLLHTNGQTDNFTIGKANLMMRAFVLASVAKHVFPNGNSVHFSTNHAKQAGDARPDHGLCRSAPCVRLGAVFIFVISNIFVK